MYEACLLPPIRISPNARQKYAQQKASQRCTDWLLWFGTWVLLLLAHAHRQRLLHPIQVHFAVLDFQASGQKVAIHTNIT